MSRRRWIPLWIAGGLLLSLLFLAFHTLQLYQMVGHSMDPTIPANSVFLTRPIFRMPAQGDIVVLRDPAFMDEPMVKRVIATGGQHVTVDLAASTVTIDGRVLDEPYLLEPMADIGSPFMTALDVTVPEGFVYVMGDNRNHSSDSRDERLGPVSEDCILGKVLLSTLPSQKADAAPYVAIFSNLGYNNPT